MRACQHRHALGRPGEGVHAARVGDAALFDVVGTLVGAYAAHRASGVPLVVSIVGALVAGEAAHWYFCVDTATQRWLRGRATP